MRFFFIRYIINIIELTHGYKKMPSENEISNSKRPPPGPPNSYYAEESSQSVQNENKNQSYTRTTERVSKQWISENESSDITPREHSYTPLFHRSYYSQSKSPSPNFNTLHRKNELPAPKIKLNH